MSDKMGPCRRSDDDHTENPNQLPPSDLWGWDYQHIRQKLMLRRGETGVTDQSRQRPAPQTSAKH